MEPIGVYVHVPFCVSKCPYCDFYSRPATQEAMEAYTQAAVRVLLDWGVRLNVRADTLYLGGGTPSLLGGRRLQSIMHAARRAFGLEEAEITLEANPADDLEETLRAFAAAGGNRLSLGMQEVSEDALRFLGRRHRPADVERAVRDARRAGLSRLSLDIMLGLPGQEAADAARAAARCRELGASHVSAYLLKVEPGTPLSRRKLQLPDEDAAADVYAAAADALAAQGYRQYEISNFSDPGCESRHNLKYWNQEPYLGVGPAAHSFLDGRRFAYPRDLAAFLRGEGPQAEKRDEAFLPENGPEEYLMLRIRLTDGIRETDYAARFGEPIPALWRERAASLPASLLTVDGEGLRLTREGFLVSNAILGRLLNG